METNLLFPVLPFYFIARQNLVGDISDTTLALMCPVIAFWMFSVFFDLLDNSGWRFFEQYRIHESNEIKSRNLATKSEVVINVIAGYLIQTIVGIIYLNDLPDISLSHCSMELEEMQTTLVCFIKWMARPKLLVDLLIFHKTSIVYWLYCFIFDTWMYFNHGLMYMNKFLYKHVHSVHHRLYIPYGYGAMYNHPVEGFLLDVMGSIVASIIAGLTPRQNMVLFTFTVIRAVFQHSGYEFPCDPFRWFCENTADFHDIHHQAFGPKYNFSQPLFVHWDVIMGTRMTKKDIKERRQKIRSRKAI